MPARENFRDTIGKALASSKKHTVDALVKRMGPPPSSVAARMRKDDDHDAYWMLGDGWPEDAAGQAAKEAEMYRLGAKQDDILKVKYPKRVELIPYGDRRDDIEAQVKFCREMVVRHMELLADEAVKLRDSMREGEDGRTSGY